MDQAWGTVGEVLGELLEERDTQLQELTSARRDREKLRLKLADLEERKK